MTETTTAATKARATEHAARSFDMPDYGIPKFDLPNMEMPEAFREMTEKSVAHTRDAYAKAKVASEDAADMLEKAYEVAAKRTADYNRKIFEIARTNMCAAFDCANELMGVKSPSEFIELSTAQMRKQFERMSTQSKDLCALAQETATAIAEPIKTGVSKVFNKAT